MKAVKLGIVGLGHMGHNHLRRMKEVGEVELVGVADVNIDAARRASEMYGVPGYGSHIELMEQSGAEAVLVVVPHPFHPQVTMDAAQRGLHVLCEKPISVTISEADQMIEACEKAGVLLGINFQTRLAPHLAKAKEIVDSGILGDLVEVEMVSTNWYRLQSYYDSGSWRGTWKGEGGGILANQTPHNLDHWVWLAGLPKSVSTMILRRFHDIEVENTVHAIMRYDGLATGYFRATTADPLGEGRIELCGTHGRLRVQGKELRLCRFEQSIPHHIQEAKDRKSDPFNHTWEEVAVDEGKADHGEVIRRFARGIRLGEPLVATGHDGRRALELANAMLLSGVERRVVDLPLDPAQVDRLFDGLRSGEVQIS